MQKEEDIGRKITYIANIALSMVAIVLLCTIASPCSGSTRCVRTVRICETLFAAAGLCNAFAIAMYKNPVVGKIALILQSLLSFVHLLVVKTSGLCSDKNLLCNKRSLPVIAIFASVLFGVSFVMIAHDATQNVAEYKRSKTKDL